jgi:ubiquinone/menaquinone biosynthesis C-methylase UbiE
MLTDSEIIEKLNIKEGERILDIGGSMKQHSEIKIDTLIDIIRPEDAPYGKSKLKAKKFIKVDVTSQKLPIGDKEFDVCLCTHTLEDLVESLISGFGDAKSCQKRLNCNPLDGG